MGAGAAGLMAAVAATDMGHKVTVIEKNEKAGKKIFITGHLEYDPLTLKEEYERDLAKGLEIKVPKNYFKNDNPALAPMVRWRSHASLLFSNWLNYCVYQVTPYNLD